MTCKILTKNNIYVLSFTGDSAKWPSKSNDAMVAYRNGKPFVRHTKEYHKRTANIKAQYRLACQSSLTHINYGTTEIMALCLLGKKTRMYDSHNFCKGFCDFAEEVGIIDNDRHITCWPIHKKTCGIMGISEESTDVLIKPTSDFNFDKFFEEFTNG